MHSGGTLVIRRLPTGGVEVSDVVEFRGRCLETDLAVYAYSSSLNDRPQFGVFSDVRSWLREHEQRGFTFTRKP